MQHAGSSQDRRSQNNYMPCFSQQAASGDSNSIITEFTEHSKRVPLHCNIFVVCSAILCTMAPYKTPNLFSSKLMEHMFEEINKSMVLSKFNISS